MLNMSRYFIAQPTLTAHVINRYNYLFFAIDWSAAYSVAFGVLVGDEPDGEVEGVVAGLEEAAGEGGFR
jgi:hypothetical protein